MEFFATCAGGLEALLADELRSLGCDRVRPLKGQVSFEGGLPDAYRACLWSRLASRVVVVLARVGAGSADELYDSLRALDWTAQLLPGASLAVDAHGTNAELRNTRFTALRAKDAISDALFAAQGARPVLDVQHPDLSVVVRIARERATVGIDLAGEPLFHRGYGTATGQRGRLTSLRADYAAALMASTGWAAAKGEGQAFFALYPGAGTLLAEAAAQALDRAPGLLHERWGMAGWASHDDAAWQELLTEAHDRAREGATRTPTLLVRDPRRGAQEACAHLLRAAGMDVEASFVRASSEGDVDALASVGVLRAAADLSWICGLGVAEQAGAVSELAGACAAIPEGRLAVLSPEAVVDRAVGTEPTRKTELILGRYRQVIRCYELARDHAGLPHVELGTGEEVAVLVPGSEQFAKRLAKVAKRRARWATQEDVSCYRIYDADLPDYAVTIDLFQGVPTKDGRTPPRWLSIFEYAPPKDIDQALARARLLDVLSLSSRVLGIEARNVFVRTRQRSRGGSQYADEGSAASSGRGRPSRKGPLALPPGAHLVEEGGLVFEVNFSGRLDCGLFLDHRDTRAMVREMAKHLDGNGRFLNLFAYTGSATCYAADGGAQLTTTVDLSRPSLDWARRNMGRNGFVGEGHEYVQADVMRWLASERRGRNRWDLIFCDVPTFSNSSRMKKASFDVQRDHVELLISVSRLLTRAGLSEGWPGGTCVFSCNLRSFKPDAEGLRRAGVEIKDITAETIPADFARNQKVHHCYLVRRIQRT